MWFLRILIGYQLLSLTLLMCMYVVDSTITFSRLPCITMYFISENIFIKIFDMRPIIDTIKKSIVRNHWFLYQYNMKQVCRSVIRNKKLEWVNGTSAPRITSLQTKISQPFMFLDNCFVSLRIHLVPSSFRSTTFFF